MDATKYFCGGCGTLLDEANWFPSLQRTKQCRCRRCFARQIPKSYCTICGLRLEEGRCSECYILKENRCKKCDVLLTDDNWQPSFKKRKVGRCKACHLAVCLAWESRNPGHGAKRQKAYHARNPEKQPAYYREHKEEYAQRAIERLWRLKTEAIAKLGGKCVVCGLTDMRLLQINHLNGRSEAEKKKFGHEMYQIIVDGSRTLHDLDVRCANHNLLYEYERGMRRMPADASFHTRETAMDVTEATEESQAFLS